MAASMLAVGFALRRGRGFTWANCAQPWDPGTGLRPSSWELNPNVRRRGPVDPRELEIPSIRPETIDQVVEPDTPEERHRLLGLLTLPPFLQDLVSLSRDVKPVPPVVFSHLDALPVELIDATFSNLQVHETLHRGGVSLLATFFGSPTLSVRDAFDQIYRIEDVGGRHWADAFVWSERGLPEVALLLPRPLREVWPELRLDPDLLSD